MVEMAMPVTTEPLKRRDGELRFWRLPVVGRLGIRKYHYQESGESGGGSWETYVLFRRVNHRFDVNRKEIGDTRATGGITRLVTNFLQNNDDLFTDPI